MRSTRARPVAQRRATPWGCLRGAGAGPAAPPPPGWSPVSRGDGSALEAAPAAELPVVCGAAAHRGGGNRPTVRSSGEGLIGIEILISHAAAKCWKPRSLLPLSA
jgi:hypothetical protein